MFLSNDRHPGIIWAVPLRDNLDKYERAAQQQREKYGVATTIDFERIHGTLYALNYQDLLPLPECYVEKVIDTCMLDAQRVYKLKMKLDNVIGMCEQGKKCVFTNVGAAIESVRAFVNVQQQTQ